MGKADGYFYGDICSYYNEVMEVYDHDTDMFKTATKLFEKCEITDFMRNLKEDATRGAPQDSLCEDLEHYVGEEGTFDLGEPVIRDGTFRVDEFKQALDYGQDYPLYQVMVQSNAQANGNYKLPSLALFLDWADRPQEYRY